jgi:hypothetical protein
VLWDGYENLPRFMVNGGPQECGRRLALEGGRAARRHRAVGRGDHQARPRRAGRKTLPGVAIRHTGIVRLERADGGIRLDVTLSSNPLAGPAGTR